MAAEVVLQALKQVLSVASPRRYADQVQACRAAVEELEALLVLKTVEAGSASAEVHEERGAGGEGAASVGTDSGGAADVTPAEGAEVSSDGNASDGEEGGEASSPSSSSASHKCLGGEGGGKGGGSRSPWKRRSTVVVVMRITQEPPVPALSLRTWST